MKRLRPCDGCSRHVFVSERACPFCQTALEPAPDHLQVPVPSTASRAQRLALAAVLGSGGLMACAQTNGEADSGQVEVPVYGAPVAGTQWVGPVAGSQPPTAGRGPSSGDAGLPSPVYGAPVYGAPIAGQPAPQPMRPDAGMRDAGGPVDEDGGVDEGAAGAGGAGGRDGMASPVYGAPIPEYGAPPPPPED